jgi:TetR/AcrR family transcriptional regulator, transcriptional repressor for nem operon
MPRPTEFDRDTVLNRAEAVFWEHGYEGTSIEELTNRAGIGRASLYNAFGDKRGLLAAVVERYQSSARTLLAEFLAQPLSGHEAISTLLRTTAEPPVRGKEGCMCLILSQELGDSDPELQQQTLAGIRRLTDALHTLIVRGHRDRSIPTTVNASTTAEGLSAAIVGMNALKRMHCPSSHLKSMAESQLSLLD